MDTPTYIKSLLMPNGRKPAGRRVWSVDLESVWLPFFTATNLMGDTALPFEALGAPLRLAYNADGSVKFSKAGRPVIKVAREIADSVKLIRENFVANLTSYANEVATENPEGYTALQEQAKQAGEPITTTDRAKMEKAIAEAMAEAVAEAKAKAHKPKKEEKVAVTA